MCQLSKGVLALSGVDRCVDTKMARQDAIHITIDSGNRKVEGYRTNGCCGIVAYTFQFLYVFIGVRKMP